MIGTKAWRPVPDHPSIRLVHASGMALTYGVEVHTVDGVRVRITGKAKTVRDGKSLGVWPAGGPWKT